MNPTLSAIICTYNRPESLRRSIQSLVEQTLQKEMYEIVVVDNTTTKTAHAVVAEFLHVKNVRYVHEPVVGNSQARNTGFKNARGKYIAYLDDDATADKEWLANIYAAFTKSEAVCVGGKVEIVLETERPSWLTDELLFCLGELSCAENPIVLNDTNHYLHGCNIAFKKEMLARIGVFNKDLGRVGQNLISCEEILVQKIIRKNGGVCLYSPDIVVHHHVKSERLTRKWFLRRLYAEGVSLARMQIYDEHPSIKKRLSMALYELLHIFKDGRTAFSRRCKIRKDVGYIGGLLGA